MTAARPKLRGTSQAFASRLFGTGITKSEALEALVIAALPTEHRRSYVSPTIYRRNAAWVAAAVELKYSGGWMKPHSRKLTPSVTARR